MSNANEPAKRTDAQHTLPHITAAELEAAAEICKEEVKKVLGLGEVVTGEENCLRLRRAVRNKGYRVEFRSGGKWKVLQAPSIVHETAVAMWHRGLHVACPALTSGASLCPTNEDMRAPEGMHTTVPDIWVCLLYTSPSPRDLSTSRMPSSA